MTRNNSKLDHIISLALCEGDKKEHDSFMDIDDSDIVIPPGEIKKLRRAVTRRLKRDGYAKARKVIVRIIVAAMLVMSLSFVALMSISATREAILAVFTEGGGKCYNHKPSAAATCTVAQVCTVCGEELAPPLPHTLGKEATCTTAQTCTVCNMQITPALGHTAGAVATCTTAQTCTVCNVQLSPTVVHIAGNVATCTEWQTCLVCDKVLAEPFGHTPSPEATCKTPQSCTVCGEILSQVFVHSPGEKATCTTPQTCTVCDKVLMDAKGHSPENPFRENIVHSTCTETGIYDSVVYCRICSLELSREKMVIEEFGEHDTVNYFCRTCEQYVCSPGLDLVLNAAGDGYILRGIGTCTDETIYVGMYNNLPVTTITSSFSSAYMKKLIIGDTVTCISAFTLDDISLTELYIGKNLVEITDLGRHDLPNFKSITVHEDNPAYSSVDGHLYNKDQTVLLQYSAACTDKEFTVPDTVETIDPYAFTNAVNLESVIIGDSVKSIGYAAFMGCTSLEVLVVGNSVEVIDSFAFNNCTALVDVTLGESITTIGGNVFSYCESLESILLPDSLEQIRVEAFYKCTALKKIDIPSSVVSIGGQAFMECSSLESVTLPEGLTAIEFATFSSCVSLRSIVVPEGVTSIGSSAFESCQSLESINLPEGITTISDRTFKRCYLLKDVVLPAGVTHIGYEAFRLCSQIRSINLPDGLISIGEDAFALTGLTEITIPGTVTEIGMSAFECKYLSSVIYSEGITTVTHGVFIYDTIKTISIPASVTTISAFMADCTNLEYISVDENNQIYCDIDGNLYSKSGKNLIAYAKGKTDRQFTVPDTVEAIGASAFSGETDLVRVVLGDNVTKIGYSAFNGCINLVSVTLGESLGTVGNGAFNGCYSLVEVINKSSLTPVNSSHGGVAQYAIDVHDGESRIVEVDGYLFYLGDEANYLVRYIGGSKEKIILPLNINGETYIVHSNAFEITSGVKFVTISDGVTKICEKAFTIKTPNVIMYISDSVVAMEYEAITFAKLSPQYIFPLTVLCEATEMPYEWYPYSYWVNYCTVVWGYTGQ